MKKIFLKLFTLILFSLLCMFSTTAEAYLQQLSPQSFNALYDLASRGNVSAINNARSRGLNIDSVNANGDTGLCVAAKYRNRKAFKSFLQSGANPSHRCTWEISGYRDFLRSVVENPVKNLDTAVPANKGLLSSMSLTTKALIGAGIVAAGAGTAIALSGGGGGGGHDADPNCVHGHWESGVCVCNTPAYTGEKCNQCAPGYDYYGTNECHLTIACANGGTQKGDKCICPAAYADGNLCEGCGPGYGRGTDGKCVGIEQEKVVGNEGYTNTNYNIAGTITLNNSKYTTVYGLFYDADNTPAEVVIDKDSFANGYFSIEPTEYTATVVDYTRDTNGNILWYETGDDNAAGYIDSLNNAYSYATASIVGWAEAVLGGYIIKENVNEELGASKIASADYAWNPDGSIWWYKDGQISPAGYIDLNHIILESASAYGNTGTDPVGMAYKDADTFIYQVQDDSETLGTAAPTSRVYVTDSSDNILWYQSGNNTAVGYIDSLNNAYSYATSSIVGWAALDTSGLHIVKHTIEETVGGTKTEEKEETTNYLVLNKHALVDITNTSDSIVYGLYSPKVSKIYNVYVSLESSDILVSDLTTFGPASASSTISINNTGDGNVYGIYGNHTIYSGDLSGTADEESQTGSVYSFINITNQGNGDAYGIYNGLKTEDDTSGSTGTAGIYHQIKANGNSTLQLYSYTAVTNTSGKGNTYGLYSLNAITNSGIVLSSADAGNAYGLYSSGGTITNSPIGSIENSVTAVSTTGNAYGAYIEDGQITNGRVITAATTAGTGTAYGIYATQSEGKQTTVVNNSGLTVSSQGGDAYGIYNKGGSVTNTTDYYPISVTSLNGTAYGIYSDGGSVTNSGHIYVYGPSKTKTYGIYATNGATVKNTGNFVFIVGIGGAEAQSLDWRDEAAYCTNCSSLTTAEGGYAVYLTGGAKFDNSGSLATTSNLSLGSKGVSISKGGSFSASSISGNLSVSNEVVSSGFENKYILENAILTDDASALTLSSQSALFDATLSGTNIVLTKKNFADVLKDNSSIAAFLEQNYASQTNAALFESLKQKTNKSELQDAVSKLTGQGVLSRFSSEDLLMEKEFNFDLAEKMFNLKDGAFSLSNSVKPQIFSGKSSQTQYALSGNKTKDLSFGIGLAVSDIASDDGHRGNNRRSKHIQLLAPFEASKNGFRFLSSPKLGYAYGTYTRSGYENQSFNGKIEKRTFSLANGARYPVRIGDFELSPAVELNLSAYQTKIKEDAKTYSLSSKRELTYSAETGFGAYFAMQKDLSKTSRFSFNAGALLYHEFANPYDLTLCMNNTSGYFKLTDENRRDDYLVLRSKFSYDFGAYSFYGSFLSYVDSQYRTRADLGFKYTF